MVQRKGKRIILFLFFSLILGGISLLFTLILKSRAFEVKDIEFIQQAHYFPEYSNQIQMTVKKSLNSSHLFSLNLKKLKSILLADPWVQEVKLIKKLPHQLKVEFFFRKPIALFKNYKNQLFYVDEEGKIFEPFQVNDPTHFPVLIDFQKTQASFFQALDFIREFKQSKCFRFIEIQSILPKNYGFECLVKYPLSQGRSHTTKLEIGKNFKNMNFDLNKLGRLFTYLKVQSMITSRVIFYLDRKAVVKLSHVYRS